MMDRNGGPEHPEGTHQSPDVSQPEGREQRSARVAAIVFAVGVAVAFPTLLYLGSDRWFRGDEWGLLAGRSLNLDDLFSPQNGHWLTLPTLSYHLIYRIVGLHSYLPYMSVVIALHLTLATLLRVVMRRAGVGPWVATVVAFVFVLFGAGHENVYTGMQVSLVGSMVYGFAHLLLADHDGGFDWRDGAGLVCGLLGLLSSGLAPPLIAVVGLAVLIRRGWLMALVHTVPLAMLYGAWYLYYLDDVRSGTADGLPTIDVATRWIWTATSGVFLALGDRQVVAIALAVVLAVGLFLAWRPLPWADLRVRASMPLALLLGEVVIFGVISTQRWRIGADFARSSRYLALGAALALPAMGVAINAIVHRWKPAGAVALALVVFGVPANVAMFRRGSAWPFAAERAFVLGAAYSPLARDVRGDAYLNPDQFLTDQVTVGFLRAARAAGRLPDEPAVPESVRSKIINRLSVSQSLPDDGHLTTGFDCRTRVKPLRLTPEKGDQFGLRGPVRIATRTASTVEPTEWTGFDTGSAGGDLLTVEVDDLIVYVEPDRSATTFTWCTPP